MRTATLLALAASLGTAGCGVPKMNAIYRGDTAAVQRFLDEGTPADTTVQGMSLLGKAAAEGNAATVKLLLSRGADIHKKSRGRTPLEWAVLYDRKENAQLLRDAEAKSAAGQTSLPIPSAMTLCKALIKGDLEESRALLDRGADPNARVDNGYSLFNCAIQSKRADLVRLLIARGAKRSAAFESPGWGRPTDHEFAQNMRLPEIVALFTEEPRKSPGNLDDAAYERMRAAAGMPPEKKAPVSDADSPSRREAARPDDYALVIGIEKYSRLPEAAFAENDADAMKRHLLALGYPERNIVVLKGGQATRGAISGYVEEWLPKNAKPSSRVLVYFSGHGSPDAKTGDAYLVPWDGDAMFLKSTAYPLKSLYASLAKLKAKRVLVALDSCFSGAGGRSVLAEGARPLVTRVDEAEAPAGVTVLSAASGDEITATIKDQGHGAFTYYLLKAFNNGKLTAKAAYEELKPLVQDEARRQNREQTPLLLGDDAPF